MNRSGGSNPHLTRRAWTALFTAVPLLAQVSATPQSPTPLVAPAAGTPEQRMAKAAADVRQVSDRLAQTEVPMSLEPAFSFRA